MALTHHFNYWLEDKLVDVVKQNVNLSVLTRNLVSCMITDSPARTVRDMIEKKEVFSCYLFLQVKSYMVDESQKTSQFLR